MHILPMNIAPWYTCMAYTGMPILCCDICNMLLFAWCQRHAWWYIHVTVISCLNCILRNSFLVQLLSILFVVDLNMQFWIIGMPISCWLTMELQEDMELSSFSEGNWRSTYPFRNYIQVWFLFLAEQLEEL